MGDDKSNTKWERKEKKKEGEKYECRMYAILAWRDDHALPESSLTQSIIPC